MTTTPELWEILEDPVELAMCRNWMTPALKEVLDGQALFGSSEDMEYFNHYADGIVRSTWSLAHRENLVRSTEPVVQLFEDCGWRLSAHAIGLLLGAQEFAELGNRYREWLKLEAPGIRDNALAAYCEGLEPQLRTRLTGQATVSSTGMRID